MRGTGLKQEIVTEDDTQTLEGLSVAAHGGSVALHTLGAAYHWNRRSREPVKAYTYMGVHLAAAAFSLVSMKRHFNRL